MAGQQPAWMTEDPTDLDGGAMAPAWMEEDGTFGDVAPPNMHDVPHTPVTKDWNIFSSLGNGMSLGFGIPASAGILTANEARRWLQAGASWDFVKKKLPDWYAQYHDHISQAHKQFKETSPGSDLSGEVLGSIPPTVVGTGLASSAIQSGLRAAGLPALAGVLAGTAGRAAPATATMAERFIPRLASEATRNTGEGTAAGVLQSQLNPTKSIGEQAREGATMGALATIPMQGAKLAGRGTFGTVDPRVAQDALDSGVKIPAGQIAQQPAARAVTRSFGGMPNQPADIARVRQSIATQYADIAAKSGTHSLAVDPTTGVVSGPRLQAALDRQLATTPWHFDADLYTRLRQVRRQEDALNAIEPHLSAPPTAHPWINRLSHIGTHAGVGAGLAEATILALQHPHSWPIIAAGAGGGAVARKLGNVLMNSEGVRRLQLNAAARGLTPTEYLDLGNPAIAGGNALMEYYGVHPNDGAVQ